MPRAFLPAPALLCVLGAFGCGPGRGSPGFLPAAPPFYECVVAGPHRIQPIFAETPASFVPTGLYARRMDPIALAGLGFTRDHVVCAALFAPPRTDGLVPLSEVIQAHDEGSRRAAAGRAGACTCDAARRAGLADLLAGCEREPTTSACAGDEEAAAAVAAFREELVGLLVRTRIPWVHVRMAGRTDRPGWFRRRASRLIARHPGPSDVYFRDDPPPAGLAFAFVRKALSQPDVTAVVRQDMGQAFLVVREVGDTLVLDHVRYPVLPASRRGLVRLWEEVHPDAVESVLARPSDRLVYDHDPRTASVFVIDAAKMMEVDAAVAEAAALAGRGKVLQEILGERPEPTVARAVVWAPFGRGGDELAARLELSEEGRLWAQTIPGDVLSPTLDELGPPPVFPEVPADAPFLYVGRCAERFFGHGPRLAARWSAALERAHPGAISGRPDDFEVGIPRPPPTWEGCDEGTSRLVRRLQQRPHVLAGGFDPPRTALRVRLSPAGG